MITAVEQFKALMEALPPEMKTNVKKISVTWRQCGEFSGELVIPEFEILYFHPEDFA